VVKVTISLHSLLTTDFSSSTVDWASQGRSQLVFVPLFSLLLYIMMVAFVSDSLEAFIVIDHSIGGPQWMMPRLTVVCL